ncbi:MAG: YfcE family phosphodiesterase [Candidatus Hecatellales archaeon]|nr:MAG: YfcE family phosphodiesterase [Candidatus Hecatellales archaeon]
MAVLGLISDTHDNLEAIRRAVEVFNQRKVKLVLHAGDFNSPFTSTAFKGLEAKLIGVYGNVDGERSFLKQRYEEVLNAEIRGEFAEVEVEGRRIALLHGVIQPIVEALALSHRYHVVVRGHTHKPETLKLGEALIVNPGEACGYLTGRRTIGLLNLETLEVEIVEI